MFTDLLNNKDVTEFYLVALVGSKIVVNMISCTYAAGLVPDHPTWASSAAHP